MSNIEEFKKQYIKTELQITEEYGRILSIIDFGNVNYWFEDDKQDADSKLLTEDKKLQIDLTGLYDFTRIFSGDIIFYYGTDSSKEASIRYISVVKSIFGKNKVFSKQIQYIRHHLKDNEIEFNKRKTFTDKDGIFVKIPKCNFDVEICVDSIRKIESYDTLVLFSSDADFVALTRYLRRKRKKVILIKGGHITSKLRENVDLIVNAQKIKRYITRISTKQKPGI